MTEVSFTDIAFTGYGLEVNLADFPIEILQSLAVHGLKQILGDSVTKLDRAELGDRFTEEALTVRQQKLSALLAGQWTLKGSTGPRAVGLDKYIKDEVIRRAKINFAKRKIAFPSGKGSAEKIAEFVRAALAGSHADSIRAAAQAKMDEDLALANSLDDSDMFA